MTTTFIRGDIVRMTEACKEEMRGPCGKAGKHIGPFCDSGDGTFDCWGCSSTHIIEFQDCIGVVIGPMNYNNEGENDPSKYGPQVDVRWMPSNLRYSYMPEHLEKLPENNLLKDRLGIFYWPTIYYHNVVYKIKTSLRSLLGN